MLIADGIRLQMMDRFLSEHPINGNEIEAVAPPGLEPGFHFWRGILSPLRLPFRQGATLLEAGFEISGLG